MNMTGHAGEHRAPAYSRRARADPQKTMKVQVPPIWASWWPQASLTQVSPRTSRGATQGSKRLSVLPRGRKCGVLGAL